MLVVSFWFCMDLPMHPGNDSGEGFCCRSGLLGRGGPSARPGQALQPSGSILPAQAQGSCLEAHLSVPRTQTESLSLSCFAKDTIQTLRMVNKGVPRSIPV